LNYRSRAPSVALFIPIIIIFGVTYLLLIRPQQQRIRRHQELVSAVRVGDEVVTGSGMYGTVTELDDEDVTLEVASGVTIRFLPVAIQRINRDNGEDGSADDPSIEEDDEDTAIPTDEDSA